MIVRELSANVTTDMIRELLKSCGQIKSIRLAKDKETSLCRGFAHVEFTTVEAREAALLLSKSKKVGDNTILIEAPRLFSDIKKHSKDNNSKSKSTEKKKRGRGSESESIDTRNKKRKI